MKKLVLLLVALLALAIGAVYYLIPATLVVSEFVKTNCVSDAAFRNMAVEQNWGKWWPGTTNLNDSNASTKTFTLSNHTYSLTRKVLNNFEVTIETGSGVLPSEMNLLSIPHDSTMIRWHFSIAAGNNFFNRIAAYRRAVALKEEMATVLAHLQTYLSQFKNVYGFSYAEGSTKDTLLLSTKSFSTVYPSTDFVYALIGKLKKFSEAQGLFVTGIPMLNISAADPSGYKVMVALPVNREVTGKDSVSMIRMVPGKFIITEVTGGPKTIQYIHRQMGFYFQDYRRVTMAIPFDYLVTDRQKETDTSKWITRIYAPVY